MFHKSPKKPKIDNETKIESSFERIAALEGIENRVLSFLPLNERLQASRITQGFYQINQSDLIWRERYQQDFGPIIFEGDYRRQYYAMHFYQLANSQRADKANFYSKKLVEFIREIKRNDNAVAPWTCFFIGAMYFDGKGCERDKDEGEDCLWSAVNSDDYRAARFLINKTMLERGILENNLDHRCLDCLEDAYDKGFTQAAREIAYYYVITGEGNAKKQEQAKTWLLKYLETHDDLEAAKVFSNLFLRPQVEDEDDDEEVVAENLPDQNVMNAGENENHHEEAIAADEEDLSDEEDEEETPEDREAKLTAIQALRAHFEKFPTGAVACQIGNLYSDLNNLFLARCYWRKAERLKNGSAIRHLTNWIYLTSEARRKLYENGFAYGEISLAQDLANSHHLSGHLDERLSWLKKGFLAGVNDCAKTLSDGYLETKGWHENPNQVCWIQAVSQCANNNATQALLQKMKENEGCNYATCALWVILSLGVFQGSSQDEKAIEITSSKLNWDILEKYQAALKQEGLLEPYIANLFVEWQKRFDHVNKKESKKS